MIHFRISTLLLLAFFGISQYSNLTANNIKNAAIFFDDTKYAWANYVNIASLIVGLKTSEVMPMSNGNLKDQDLVYIVAHGNKDTCGSNDGKAMAELLIKAGLKKEGTTIFFTLAL